MSGAFDGMTERELIRKNTYEKLAYSTKGLSFRSVVMSEGLMSRSIRGILVFRSTIGSVQLASMHFKHTMVNARLACPGSTSRSEYKEAPGQCVALRNSLTVK